MGHTGVCNSTGVGKGGVFKEKEQIPSLQMEYEGLQLIIFKNARDNPAF